MSSGIFARLGPGVVGLVTITVAAPLVALGVAALTPTGDIWAHLSDTVLADYLVESAILCVGVAALTLVLGVVPAWLCSTLEFPGRRVFEWLLILPLALPPYVVAYIYTGMLDFGGDLHELIAEQFGVRIPVRSMAGGIAVLSLTLYPYTYLFVRTALRRQSVRMLEAGRMLRASPLRVFVRVILPSIRPAVAAATAIVLMETLADYGTVQYFGINTFSVGIIRTWFALESLEGAVQLSLILLAFMLLLLYMKSGGQREKYQQHDMRGGFRRRVGAPMATVAVVVCLTPPLLGFILPVAQLFVWLPRSSGGGEHLAPLFNSLTLAASAAFLLLAVALLLAYTRRLCRAPAVRLTIGVATSGYAVPGVVIAAGILVLASGLNSFGAPTTFTLALSGGFAGLFLAYLVRYLTLSFNAIDSAMSKIPASLDEAARMLKATAAGVVLRIHAPLIGSGLFAAFLLAFVEVVKELPATLVLRPFNYNTLAVHIYELAADERLVDIAPHTLSLALIGLLPIFIIVRTVKNL